MKLNSNSLGKDLTLNLEDIRNGRKTYYTHIRH